MGKISTNRGGMMMMKMICWPDTIFQPVFFDSIFAGKSLSTTHRVNFLQAVWRRGLLSCAACRTFLYGSESGFSRRISSVHHFHTFVLARRRLGGDSACSGERTQLFAQRICDSEATVRDNRIDSLRSDMEQRNRITVL